MPQLAANDLNYRSFKVRAKTVNEEQRSIEAMIATETPVPEWDWMRGEIVPRVLLASGAMLPKNKQVPLLDTHARWSVDSQLGSIRNLTKEDSGVSGSLTFSSTANEQWTKVREGHVTDVSAGFQVHEETYVPAGETRTIKGKQFTGPINVATKWRLSEGSIVPIGADEQAKMRGFRIAGGKLVRESQPTMPPAVGKQDVSIEEGFRMNAELRKLCVERGMDEKLSDADAQTWMIENKERLFAPNAPAKGSEERQEKPPATADEIAAAVQRALELREQAQREQREAFERDANATLELVFGSAEAIPAELRSGCLSDGSMDKVRSRISAYRAKMAEDTRLGGNFTIEGGAAQRDKHSGALRSALLVRALENAKTGGDVEKLLPSAQRAQGWETFRNARLLDLARECLVADGYHYRELAGLSPEQVAKAALGWPEKVGLRSAGYAYHTTGSLAKITQDAVNKTLLAGYQEAPQTWRGPMRQAASVPDFKTIHRIKLGAVPNLPVWNDNKDPQKASISNEEETYAVEARSLEIGFSWKLLVNDDMDALSRTPALMGDAAARTVNQVAWAQITSNPTMSDGVALFAAATGNRKRTNLTTGAGSPSVSTVGTLTNLMRQMRGLNTPEGNESEDILNLSPSYLVVPSVLETTALQLVNSIADPSNTSGIAFNTTRNLAVVVEPLLDANSTTAWYLFASPSRVDTVEVSFLMGHETPQTSDFIDERTMSRNFIIYQTFAAKAIDHRGMQKHAGA